MKLLLRGKGTGYIFFIAMMIWLFIAGLPRSVALPYTVISAGDPILDDLRFLVRESGRSFLSFTPPLSRDEVLHILDEIDTEKLGEAGSKVYRRVYDALNPASRFSDELFSLDAHLQIMPEFRIRTNTDLPYNRDYPVSPTFLSLPISLLFADTVQLAVEPIITQDPTYYAESGSHGGTNVPFDIEQVDMNMPLRGFIATGSAWWNLQLGRDKVSYGLGHTGNLALSDTPDYYDFLRLSFFSSNIKYSMFISQMPLITTGLIADGHILTSGAELLTETTQRYMYLHRLDVRLFRQVSLGISEGIMAGNTSPELRFLNPFALFHSFFAWRDYPKWSEGGGDLVGSMFSLDIEWAILPSLAIYGQFVMNEFTMAMELTDHDNPPDELGFLAGIEYTQSFNNWNALFYGEFVYTDPYLYTLSSPFSSFIWMRRLAQMGNKPNWYRWIGHPAGRDTILFTLGATLTKSDLRFAFDITLINQGEHSIRWDWLHSQEARAERTPSGIAEQKLSSGLEAAWKPISWLTLTGYIGGAMAFNANHVEGNQQYGMEFSASVAVVF
ncbi:MAG: capsule assembly Wzi family protein [Treponema sp.]|jgi:hypothetical protein|nr:capsule assembly Wzi family protein [Treponema sp.]